MVTAEEAAGLGAAAAGAEAEAAAAEQWADRSDAYRRTGCLCR